MLNLRPEYQVPFVERLKRSLQTHGATLGVLATGGGKTVCFSAVIHDHPGAAAAVVHRKEIVKQIACSLAALEIKHRVVAPPAVVTLIRRAQLKKFGKSFVDPHARVGVVSVQTITSKSSGNDSALQAWIRQVSLAVFDEGHHYVKHGLWARAVEGFSNARLLFVTATPERADGHGLGAHADGFARDMVEGPQVLWLQEHGYLSRYDYRAPDCGFRADDIPLTAQGDLNTKAMRSRVVEAKLVGKAVEHYRRFCSGKRALVFANDVESAADHAKEFNAAGIPAAMVHGGTDPGERDRALQDFEDGKILVLVNVDLFDEGFDVPAADACIMARKTMSLGKFLQMVGRVLRVVYAKGHDLETVEGRLAAIAAGPKPRAVVIDMVNNWLIHGQPNWPRVWTMDGKEKGTRASSAGLTPQYLCRECTQPYEKFRTCCPFCGAEPPLPAGRAAPDQVDGDLTLLDVDAWAELFKRMQRADMSAEDYRRDQMARGIPAVGRGADMKRHLDAKHRREVLRNLIGWWMGCHPADRTLAEKQKRFYFRFGIDVATAETLNTKETDALIAKIQLLFDEDFKHVD